MKQRLSVMAPKDEQRVLRQIQRLDRIILEKCERADCVLYAKRLKLSDQLRHELRSKNLIEFEL